MEVGDDDVVAGHLHDLVLAEFDGIPGVRDERRDVRAQEVLAVAAAGDQR